MKNRRTLSTIIITTMVVFVNEFNYIENDNLGDYLEMTREVSGNNINWPSKRIKNEFIECGKYEPSDIIPTRFQFYRNNVYIVMPKYRKGVPFSLGRISFLDKDYTNPKVFPYPSWNDHDVSNNRDAIINAVDIFIDRKIILWILDCGIVNTLEKPEIIGLPRAIGIDPKTSKKKYEINLEKLTLKSSRLQFIVAEVVCGKTTLFISDAGTKTIIVFDVDNNKGFRVVLPPEVIKGQTNKDILYLLITHRCRKSTLYFTYLGSKNLYAADSESFRLGKTQESITTKGVKPRSIVFLGTDNCQNIFFRYQGCNKIYLWNSSNPFKTSNFILITNPDDCRISTHVITGYRNLMWTMSSNFRDYICQCVGCVGPSTKIYPLIKYLDDVEDG